MLWCSDADSEATHPDSDESTPQLQGSFPDLNARPGHKSGDAAAPKATTPALPAEPELLSEKAYAKLVRRQQREMGLIKW